MQEKHNANENVGEAWQHITTVVDCAAHGPKMDRTYIDFGPPNK